MPPSIANERSALKQPASLYTLFFTEMWERFSFYGMKALLLAYMVTQLKFDEPRSYGIVGSYMALVYAMPMFGGMLADRILGYRKAIIFGGLLMATGHFILAIPSDWSFFYGMAFIICGNGFFKPNVSGMVGTLYEPDDRRKDSAFSIFYMGINLGAAVGGALCGYVGQFINWHYGFGLAGIGMIIGLTVFTFGKRLLGERGLPPDRNLLKKKIAHVISVEKAVYAGTILLVPVVVMLFNLYAAMNWIMIALGPLALAYILFTASRLDSIARNKLLVAVILIIVSVLFWSFYEQNTGSLNLFAMRNVDMRIGGRALPALGVNNFLPPFWVIALSPFFGWLWLWLNKKNREPSTPVKFSLSFIFMGLGFFIFFMGCKMNQATGLIPLWVFATGYFAIICGELCLSPIGLSMITKLSPPQMVGMMMGTWFLATATGDFLSGKIGALMSVPAGISDPVKTLSFYASILNHIGLISVLAGVLLLCLARFMKKWTSKQ